MKKMSGFLEASKDFVGSKVTAKLSIMQQVSTNIEDISSIAIDLKSLDSGNPKDITVNNSSARKRCLEVTKNLEDLSSQIAIRLKTLETAKLKKEEENSTAKRKCLEDSLERNEDTDNVCKVQRKNSIEKGNDELNLAAISDKSSTIMTNSSKEKGHLSIEASIADVCSGDSHEVMFIPFPNSDSQLLDSSASKAEAYTEVYQNMLPSQKEQISLPNISRNKISQIVKQKSKWRVYRGVRKRRRRVKKRVVVEKSKVIVEMAPTFGICLSDISALRESDCESDILDGSDDSNKLNYSETICATDKTIRHEAVHVSIPHITQSESICHKSDHSGLDIPVQNTENIHKSPNKRAVSDSNKIFHNSNNDSAIKGNHTQPSLAESIASFHDEEYVNDPVHEVHASEREIVIDTSNQIPINPVSRTEDMSLEIAEPQKKRKKRSVSILGIHVEAGRGKKLRDIACLKVDIDDTPLELLSLFHVILFEVPGSVSNSQLVNKMKHNILEFSGFLFDKSLPEYFLKERRIKRLHYQVVVDIADLLFGRHFVNRIFMVGKILNFLMCPTNEEAEEMRSKRQVKKINHLAEISRMKKEIISGRGPKLQFELKRLTAAELEKYNCTDSSNLHTVESPPRPETPPTEELPVIQPDAAILEKNRKYPAYLNQLIKNSLQKKGQSETSGMNANTNDIDLEKISKDKVVAVIPAIRQSPTLSGTGKSLKSIPEVAERVKVAEHRSSNLIHTLLFGYPEEIEKEKVNILNFSGFAKSQQSLIAQRKRFLRLILTSELKNICEIFKLPCDEQSNTHSIDNILEFLNEPSDRFIIQKNFEIFSALLCNRPLHKPLSSHENIRFNIECATPDDLTELHDILFLKPCDTFEIHQRVLEFNGFTFDINSSDYYIRQTLMTYMSINSLRKIAKLLDLTCFLELTHKGKIFTGILKFLTDFQLPAIPSGTNKARILILKTAHEESCHDLFVSSESSSTPDRMDDKRKNITIPGAFTRKPGV